MDLCCETVLDEPFWWRSVWDRARLQHSGNCSFLDRTLQRQNNLRRVRGGARDQSIQYAIKCLDWLANVNAEFGLTGMLLKSRMSAKTALNIRSSCFDNCSLIQPQQPLLKEPSFAFKIVRLDDRRLSDNLNG